MTPQKIFDPRMVYVRNEPLGVGNFFYSECPELLEVLRAARMVVKMDDDHAQFVQDTQHCHPDDVAQDKEYLKHTFIAIDRLRDIVDKLDQTHGTAKGDE